jgi:hypothetical protein
MVVRGALHGTKLEFAMIVSHDQLASSCYSIENDPKLPPTCENNPSGAGPDSIKDDPMLSPIIMKLWLPAMPISPPDPVAPDAVIAGQKNTGKFLEPGCTIPKLDPGKIANSLDIFAGTHQPLD